ncbi:MAG TPA: hypothetical protein VKJ07_24890, partial [Mycobacteriales bacterium]|nr:hypothetical protein [Mycobacteriales bacterium]
MSPSGAQTVAPGATLAITIAPAANYHVADVLVDGTSVGAVTTFTFTNVTANHTLAATFAIDQFAVTASSGPNGTLTCSSPVDYGQSSTCSIAPAAGYQLATLTDGLADVTSQVAAGSYVATNVTAPRSIAATFEKSQGTSCGSAGECASGHCVDGICCDRACGGQCEACDVAGSAGTCSTAAGAPHGTRAACASDGSACGGSCDGAHPAACTYPGDSISCRGPSCATGTATLGASCDGAGACPAVQTQTCAPFACGPTACSGNCSADSDCTSGNWCSAGVCAPLLAQGQTCGGGNQCGSQHCVDGLCCDTACTGQCEACAEAGTAGTCTPVGGTPRNARTACASVGSVCGGACNGTQRTACAYPAGSTTCRNPSCSSGVAVV